MTEEQEKEIVSKCPLLFKAKEGSSGRRYPICWGISVGSGWYKIVLDLSEKIEKLLENMELAEDETLPYVVQIKEKFGGLRFYMSSETQEMTNLIREAEALCWKICEWCSKEGKQTGDGWVYTLCDSCAELQKVHGYRGSEMISG